MRLERSAECALSQSTDYADVRGFIDLAARRRSHATISAHERASQRDSICIIRHPRMVSVLIDISLTLCKIRLMSAQSSVPTLPPKQALILELLVEESELYGLQLVEASKGKLKRGTVYVTLGRMEEKGFITSRLEKAPADEGGLPRRLYKASAYGRRALAAYAHVVRHLTPRLAR